MLSRKSFNALAAACVMSLGFSSATAQTVANGPYYATPSWDQTLPVATRFIVLSNMNSAAVLDRETGLVWEQSPLGLLNSWGGAHLRCNTKTLGGRLGWRLPGLQELASLIDPAVAAPGPTLPAGHPFSNVQPAYWTATSTYFDPDQAYAVSFFLGGRITQLKSTGISVWCVRGGQGIEAQ